MALGEILFSSRGAIHLYITQSVPTISCVIYLLCIYLFPSVGTGSGLSSVHWLYPCCPTGGEKLLEMCVGTHTPTQLAEKVMTLFF